MRVYIGQNEMDAHHLQGILQERGITVTVIGEALRGAWAMIPATASTLPSVWVNAQDAEQALGIVREFLMIRRESQPHETDAQGWACANCGEAIESQFATCWNCGTDRPKDETP